MKKKSILCISILTLAMISPVFAQNYEFKHYSSILEGDYRSGFDGITAATFFGKDVSKDDMDNLKNTILPI